jgi:F0F1-type ATP synthase membrane subunit b/b'
VGHDHHHKTTKVGFFDMIAGLVIFLGLAIIVSNVAGPEGFGFLKGKLSPERSIEMITSGILLISLWVILGPLVVEPYLKALYERESKTTGLASENTELRKEIEKLKAELAAEIKTARLEGTRRRDEKITAAKRQASEVVEAGKKMADEEWKNLELELKTLKTGLLSSIDTEVSHLSSEVLKKILPSEILNKYLH